MGTGASRAAPSTQATAAPPSPTIEFDDIDADDLPLPLNHIVKIKFYCFY